MSRKKARYLKNEKQMFDLSLYIITDRRLSRGRSTVEVVQRALQGGATIIQLREKELSDRELYEEGMRIKPLIKEAGAGFIVNDRIDVALALEADGVHLGQKDLPMSIARRLLGTEKIIGISAKTAEDALEAKSQGADYLGVGAIYPTETKTDGEVIVGTKRIKEIKKAVKLPIVGIGGIKLHNAKEVIKAGADGIAVVSAVTSAQDIIAACRALKEEVLKAKRNTRV